VRYGIILTAGDIHEIATMAAEAEAAGWDGVFYWDGMAIPGADPIYDGYSGEILPSNNIIISLWAQRSAGAGNLGWDYLVLVPADEEFVIGSFDIAAPGNIFDGPNDILYKGDGLSIYGRAVVPRVGSIPLVSPDQTNLYPTLRGINPNTLADTIDYTARYWPRYLYIR